MNLPDERIVDIVAMGLPLVESMMAADAESMEKLYVYSLKKVGIPDSKDTRKALELGFGIAACTMLLAAKDKEKAKEPWLMSDALR